MEEIFLIEEIWVDRWTNDMDLAVGYKILGWVNTEEEAKGQVAKGRTFTAKDCWAIMNGGLPQFRYKKLVKLTANREVSDDKGTTDRV